jgi:putative FmdB family regulatory protein
LQRSQKEQKVKNESNRRSVGTPEQTPAPAVGVRARRPAAILDVMPIYEYRCQDCRKRTSVFVRTISAKVKAKCEHCGSPKLSRLISRVTVGRSSGGLENFDESMLADVDENDPRSMARFARRMRDEMGDDLGPDFDEAIEQMEAGEMPDDDGDWPMDG